MSVSGAWQFFWCPCGQHECNLSEKVTIKRRTICRACHEKTRVMNKPKKEKMWPSDHELVIEQSIPTYVWDAYREERAE